ncbi:MAG: hypothetical protein ACI8W8_001202, partial [Rhodothermales bacterium]
YRRQIDALFKDSAYLVGITSALKQYESGDFDWIEGAFPDPRELQAILAEDGLLPFVEPCEIIMDHKSEQVLFVLGTEFDLNFGEHGINIFEQHGKWTFEHGGNELRFLEGETSGIYSEPQKASVRKRGGESIHGRLRNDTMRYELRVANLDDFFASVQNMKRTDYVGFFQAQLSDEGVLHNLCGIELLVLMRWMSQRKLKCSAPALPPFTFSELPGSFGPARPLQKLIQLHEGLRLAGQMGEAARELIESCDNLNFLRMCCR